jgi:hypothetical protein
MAIGAVPAEQVARGGRVVVRDAEPPRGAERGDGDRETDENVPAQ